MVRLFLSTIAAALVVACTASARTWYVAPDGSGDAVTIQAGVDSAAAGDSVSLANGTYSGDGNRDIGFQGKALVVTSAAGDPNSCTIRCDGTESERHNGFDFHGGEGIDAKVFGITITGGWSQYGGGIHCDEGTGPTIENCVIVANTALSYGGGVSCDYHSSPTVLNCRIVGNQTIGGDAGGLDCYASLVTVRGCTISGNRVRHKGGGVRIYQCSPVIEDCVITDNAAIEDGGGVVCDVGSPSIRNCVFARNSSSTGTGGGIDLGLDAAEVVGCTFYSNSAPNQGGAISCWGPKNIRNCTFFGNSCGSGSAVYHFDCQADAIIANCVIASGTGGVAVGCGPCGRSIRLSCCDVYGNAGGNWVGCIASQYRVSGNFSACPSFCDADHGDFHLCDQSPCLPGQNPYHYNCGLVGSSGQGCWCGPSETEPTTWGAIKAMYK